MQAQPDKPSSKMNIALLLVATALVEIPDAPHNIAGRPSQLITKIDHILAWFAKCPHYEQAED
jgi:hypothetical protein